MLLFLSMKRSNNFLCICSACQIANQHWTFCGLSLRHVSASCRADKSFHLSALAQWPQHARLRRGDSSSLQTLKQRYTHPMFMTYQNSKRRVLLPSSTQTSKKTWKQGWKGAFSHQKKWPHRHRNITVHFTSRTIFIIEGNTTHQGVAPHWPNAYLTFCCV